MFIVIGKDMATPVQNLKRAVCILYSAHALIKIYDSNYSLSSCV